MNDHGAGETSDSSGLVVFFRPVSDAVPVPSYASTGAAGADIHAWIPHPIQVEPGERVLIPSGLHVQIPQGYELQVRSRSGLAIKQGIFVINSPGTIDCDYRGEIKVILGNIGTDTVTIMPGERIAQLVLAPVIRAEFRLADELQATERGQGGFGSTGR